MRITLLLLTYKRLDYAKTTLRHALDKLTTSHELAVHIADDGSGGEHINVLREVAGGYSHVVAVGHSDSARGGYGRNFNLATQQVHLGSDIILPLEDDWKLERQLDLDPLVKTLVEANTIGCIRMGYMGFTQELKGHIEFHNQEHYLVFDPDSAEPHVWAGHPRLESREWQKKVGPWIEGLAPGATEFHMSKCPASRVGVAWPLDLIAPQGDLWSHIGTERSYE